MEQNHKTKGKMIKQLFSKIFFIISIVILGMTSVFAQITSKTKICFDKDKPFEILNSKNGFTDQSSDKDTNKYKGWTIPQKAISSIIKNSKVISGSEWHDYFGVFPCIVSGQLNQNGQKYKFEINGGSWMNIYCGRETIILGNFKKEYEKYFVSPAWDGKE